MKSMLVVGGHMTEVNGERPLSQWLIHRQQPIFTIIKTSILYGG